VLKDFSNIPGNRDWSGGGEEGLGESKPELEGVTGERNTRVESGWIDSRAESKIGKTSRTLG
jgi:hypothetical protein